MEFLQNYWTVLVSMIVLIVGGFYIPGLRNIWVIAFKVLLSETVLKRIFIAFAEKLVKSTKNPLDDIWLEEVKKKLLNK
jgi:Ni,Fe-hydrogenase I cytochrome b subunit